MRKDPEEFIANVKTNYDRLFETSPICNKDVILETKKQLKKTATDEFQIPNYLNGWAHTLVYEPSDTYEENTV